MTGESVYIKEHKQIIEGVIWRGTATHVVGGTFLKDTDIPAAYGAGVWNDERLFIFTGTGAGQTRKIKNYDGAGEFEVYDAWNTNPDTTSRYQVISGEGTVGAAAAGDATAANQVTIISKQKGTPYIGSIDDLNVNTEVDLITEVAQATVAEIDAIYVNFANWLADGAIAASGATLTIRVYLDDELGALQEVGNLRDVITEGLSVGAMVKIGGLGTFERNYKVTVESSIAPTDGAGSDHVKYHYVKYDRE